MCFKSKVRAPDTSAQEAELRRQTELLQQQFKEFMQTQTAQFEQQRAADEARYQQQRADDLAEAERQRLVLEQQLATQQQNYAEANAKAEELRQLETAQAEAKATRSRQYAEGRNQLIDAGTAAVDGAYAGFDDNFFGDYGAKIIAAEKPGLDQAYNENVRSSRLALADRGNLHSSAAARALGLQRQDYQEAEGALAGKATSAAEELRGVLNEQKRQALAGLINNAFVGNENLPDGVTDVGETLSSITSRLNNYLSDLQTQVGRYIPMAGAPAVATPTPAAGAQTQPTVAAKSAATGAKAAAPEGAPIVDARPPVTSLVPAVSTAAEVTPVVGAATSLVPTITSPGGGGRQPIASSFAPTTLTQGRRRSIRMGNDDLTTSLVAPRGRMAA